MTRLPTLAAVLLAAALFAPPPAAAVAITAGTAELVTMRTCSFAGLSGCDVISPFVQHEYGGSPGAGLSWATTSRVGAGSAAGFVALSGEIGAPLLRASAYAEPGWRTNTNSYAVQRYTYTGSEPTVRTFGGTLTYEQVVTGSYPLGVGNGVFASIQVFRSSVLTLEAGDTPQSNFEALQSGFSAWPDIEVLGDDFYNDPATTAAGLATLSASVTLNPGDTVWVRVLLQTPGVNGGHVDAFHTLVTSWNVSTDLVPAVISGAPEPGTLTLAFAAALAAGAVRRRRTNG